jgi:hypothetical protein
MCPHPTLTAKYESFEQEYLGDLYSGIVYYYQTLILFVAERHESGRIV